MKTTKNISKLAMEKWGTSDLEKIKNWVESNAHETWEDFKKNNTDVIEKANSDINCFFLKDPIYMNKEMFAHETEKLYLYINNKGEKKWIPKEDTVSLDDEIAFPKSYLW